MQFLLFSFQFFEILIDIKMIVSNKGGKCLVLVTSLSTKHLECIIVDILRYFPGMIVL